jgi:hypothetical protein
MTFGNPEKNNLEAVQGPTGDQLDKEIETLSTRLKLMQSKQNPDNDFIQFLTDKMSGLQAKREAMLGDLDFTTPAEQPIAVPKSPSRFDVADMDGGLTANDLKANRRMDDSRAA